MNFEPRRRREAKTVAHMIRIYCAAHHPGQQLPCAACGALVAFARRRLHACPYGAAKPTCSACPIHCYPEEKREQVRRVMRYAGPRMLLRHPVLAIMHWFDKSRARRAPWGPILKNKSQGGGHE